MAKKLQKIRKNKKKSSSALGSTVKDSAQQIWLAGLGAFAKAQEEGGKAFEALVKEGQTMQRKTQTAAEDQTAETSQPVSGMAQDIGARAAGRWDTLEKIFEDRVVKALAKLGIPSARDIDALHARIDALGQQLQAASSTVTVSTAARKAPPKAAGKRTASKTAAPKTTVATAAAVATASTAPVVVPTAKKPARAKAVPSTPDAAPKGPSSAT